MTAEQGDTGVPHQVEPDGWCWNCRMPRCQGPQTTRPQSPMLAQLTRIELKLNQLLRAAGVDPESPS